MTERKSRRGNPGSPHLPSVVSSDGTRWMDFRKTLTPRYAVVWRDIGLCYLALAAGLAATALATGRLGPVPALVVAVPAGAWTGWWMHALFLFGHEAAHTNLAPRRRRNDRLGDWCVWLPFGSTTAQYRRTHMAHHTHLGGAGDTETTYYLCLSVANILKGMTGIHVLQVLLRDRRNETSGKKGPSRSGARREMRASLRTVVLHAGTVGGFSTAGLWPVALSWIIGAGCVFPLCALLRTVVEHRQPDAPCSVDFTETEHGPVNRLFGDGPLSRTFGAAGFNKHLLHHWDPAISYTRFSEMEEFFARTPLAAEMESGRTGYGAALKGMMVVARRG
ncbi:fatty acid desaturase [Streptomyces sp. ODS28]|uniref:fatty acid desaturase n=1 Tax=Streptomyces sp. ODS28 TaxID=3136688 RepID=UPI0031EF5CF5